MDQQTAQALHDAMRQMQNQAPKGDQIFYLHSETIKDKVINGFNLLDIMNTEFTRNEQGVLLLDFKGRLSLNYTPYAPIIQAFCTICADKGYRYMLID